MGIKDERTFTVVLVLVRVDVHIFQKNALTDDTTTLGNKSLGLPASLPQVRPPSMQVYPSD